MGDSDTEFVTAAEVAALYGVSQATVSRWVASGRLTPVHGGGRGSGFLFRRDDIVALTDTKEQTQP